MVCVPVKPNIDVTVLITAASRVKMGDVVRLDIIVSDSPKECIQEIIRHIRPLWDTHTLIVKELQGGEVNLLYYCSEVEVTGEDDVVLVRVNGPGTEHYVDRERELLSRRIVNKAGMGAPVYCRFNNGLAYKYIPGIVVELQQMDQEFDRQMAKKLARLHLIDYRETLASLGESDKLETYSVIKMMSEDIAQMMSQTPESYKDDTKEDVVRREFPRRQDVLADVIRLEEELLAMNFPRCLCHIDPNPTNIIVGPQSAGDIHLVDWEFSRIDFAPHDIVVYFGGKILLGDYSEESLMLYPERESQLLWIRWYLGYRAELRGENPQDVREGQIAHMYRGVTLCAQIWAQMVSFFFLMQDSILPPEKESLKKARQFQKLFKIAKERHGLV